MIKYNMINAINEDDLSSLCVYLLDAVDRISENFSTYEDKYQQIIDSLDTIGKQYILSRYDYLKVNFNTIKNNLLSYPEDLMCLIRKMHEEENILSKLIIGYTEEKSEITKRMEVSN